MNELENNKISCDEPDISWTDLIMQRHPSKEGEQPWKDCKNAENCANVSCPLFNECEYVYKE